MTHGLWHLFSAVSDMKSRRNVIQKGCTSLSTLHFSLFTFLILSSLSNLGYEPEITAGFLMVFYYFWEIIPVPARGKHT